MLLKGKLLSFFAHFALLDVEKNVNNIMGQILSVTFFVVVIAVITIYNPLFSMKNWQ